MNTQPKPSPKDFDQASAFVMAYIRWATDGDLYNLSAVDAAMEEADEIWIYHIGF